MREIEREQVETCCWRDSQSLLKLLSEPKMKLIVYIYIFLSGPLAFVSSVTELAWGCSSEQAFGRDDWDTSGLH